MIVPLTTLVSMIGAIAIIMFFTSWFSFTIAMLIANPNKKKDADNDDPEKAKLEMVGRNRT
jgi:energy-converting hydrogenase Eha subunit H